jgi:hypothetical protein
MHNPMIKILLLLRIIDAAGTYLDKRCLATTDRLHTNTYKLSLVRHRPYRKEHLQHFSYWYLYWLLRERVCQTITIQI